MQNAENVTTVSRMQSLHRFIAWSEGEPKDSELQQNKFWKYAGNDG